MPREAKLFSSSSGSAVRGFLKLRANIPLDGSRMRGLHVSALSRRSWATFVH